MGTRVPLHFSKRANKAPRGPRAMRPTLTLAGILAIGDTDGATLHLDLVGHDPLSLPSKHLGVRYDGIG